jgi:hypothetical protein
MSINNINSNVSSDKLDFDNNLNGGASSANKCPLGMIMRKGYTTKRSSKKVNPVCIKDMGRPGKGPKTLPPIDKNISLADFGYTVKKSSRSRHGSLKRASKKYGTLPILKRVNLIRNYSKGVTDNYQVLSSDVNYMKDQYAKEKRSSKIKSTTKRSSKIKSTTKKN